jgi:hypothetical protein
MTTRRESDRNAMDESGLAALVERLAGWDRVEARPKPCSGQQVIPGCEVVDSSRAKRKRPDQDQQFLF